MKVHEVIEYDGPDRLVLARYTEEAHAETHCALLRQTNPEKVVMVEDVAVATVAPQLVYMVTGDYYFTTDEISSYLEPALMSVSTVVPEPKTHTWPDHVFAKAYGHSIEEAHGKLLTVLDTAQKTER